MSYLIKLTLGVAFAMLALLRPAAAQAKDWTKTSVATADGGFMIGNPDAKIRLIEFVSMSCPHCAHFDAEAHDKLISDYVKPGKLSYEIRNMVRDPYDTTAALVARCSGPDGFFPLTHRLLAGQSEWIGKMSAVPQADMDSLQVMPPEEQYKAIAGWGGMAAYAEAEGLDWAKIESCLLDPAGSDRLNQIYSSAMNDYQIRGVPAFIVNGTLVTGATWAELEPQLQPAK